MGINVTVIADSISEEGSRITTLQVKFQRFILPEFNTHRVLSRNFSSSRAIPTAKLLNQIKSDPAMPVHWGKNQSGMQADVELVGLAKEAAQSAWIAAAQSAAQCAEVLFATGAHKQIVNRIIEPYLWVTGIVTSTEWDNLFSLRAHPDAQPEFQALAYEMQSAMNRSTPKLLRFGAWHLPYILNEEREFFSNSDLRKMSAARCCRVSYNKTDGEKPSHTDDMELFDRLAGANPKHYSPLEHQATPDVRSDGWWDNPRLHGNFEGWKQFRRFDQLEVAIDE